MRVYTLEVVVREDKDGDPTPAETEAVTAKVLQALDDNNLNAEVQFQTVGIEADDAEPTATDEKKE